MRYFIKSAITNIFSFEMTIVLLLFLCAFKAEDIFQSIPLDLTVLTTLISFLIALCIIFNKKNIIERSTLIFVLLFFLFASYMTLTLLWAPGNSYGYFRIAMLWARSGWLLFAVSLIVINSSERFMRFIFLTIVFMLGLNFIFIPLAFSPHYFITRLSANYQTIGFIACFCLIFNLGLWCLKRRTFAENILRTVFSFCLIYLALSCGNRGAILSAVTAIVFTFIWYFSFNFLRKARVISHRGIVSIVLFLVVTAFFVYKIFEAYTRGLLTTVVRFEHLFEQASTGMFSVRDRVTYMSRTLTQLIPSHPLFGGGAGSWPIEMGFGDIVDYAHNIFLDVASEGGFIGLFLFILLFVYAGYIFCKNAKNLKGGEMFRPLICMVVIFNIIDACISGHYDSSYYFYTALAMLCVPSSVLRDCYDRYIHRGLAYKAQPLYSKYCQNIN